MQNISKRYYTIYLSKNAKNEFLKNQEKALTHILKKFTLKKKKIIVFGLGNEKIKADSIGFNSLEKTVATAHLKDTAVFKELNLNAVSYIRVSSAGKTGVPSAVFIKALCKELRPDFVLVIDSAVCSSEKEILSLIQITDDGILPGGGEYSFKEISQPFINFKTIGVPTLALTVPTMVIGNSPLINKQYIKDFENISNIISHSLNSAFLPMLSQEEISIINNF